MQLTVIEAARALSVSEDMIYQWIRNDQLPATRFGSRYRINRLKLIDWAHKKGVAIEVEGNVEEPLLENAIARGTVLQNVQAADLASALDHIISALPPLPGLNVEELKRFMSIRRDFGLIPGPGAAAIPDAHSPVVLPIPDSIVVIAYLSSPIVLGNRTCSTVLMSFARSTPEHLNLLTRILFSLFDSEIASLLKQRADKTVLLQRLHALSYVGSSAKTSSLAPKEFV